MPIDMNHKARQRFSGLFLYSGWPDKLKQAAIDLIFPPRCSGCGRVDTVWCDRCAAALAAIPLVKQVPTVAPPFLSDLTATGEHCGMLQSAIHALKYEGVKSLAMPLGTRLGLALQWMVWNIDVIVPVPLHPGRLSSRGYNQAQLLAETLAARHDLPCIVSALRRERETQAQVGLNREERLGNVTGAFMGDPEQLEHQAVLLVDDVCTTGATLSACAAAALEAGAQAVYGLTVTMAQL